jgi:hypothetical protein
MSLSCMYYYPTSDIIVRDLETCRWVSIPKISNVFVGFSPGFLGFLRDCSTQATTVLECSSLFTNVSILRIFFLYGVSGAQSSNLTCKKSHHLFPGYFLCYLPSEIACKRTGVSWVSRYRELNVFASWMGR